MNVCRFCGCTASQARADARALGFRDEYAKGLYTCCQMVFWADEQWLAWVHAAEQDGKPVDEVTSSLEMLEIDLDQELTPLHKKPQG